MKIIIQIKSIKCQYQHVFINLIFILYIKISLLININNINIIPINTCNI